jgi:hypothetical protein
LPLWFYTQRKLPGKQNDCFNANRIMQESFGVLALLSVLIAAPHF